MNPLDRVRLQKAASDCGFEMTAAERGEWLELRSAHFPETVQVRPLVDIEFELFASNPLMLDVPSDDGPVRLHGYGALYTALKSAAARARTMPNRVADAFRIETATLPCSTEAERLVVRRVGQEIFRAALLDYWQGRCCVTGLAVPELLRASHIKPWKDCESDDERLDVFNGLLLAPHLDALFDAGLVTVGDDSTIWISTALEPVALKCLGLAHPLQVSGLSSRHQGYMKYHREVVWRP